LRLLRALQSVRPANTREFFALAAELMRRELIDLARHFGGPYGIGANLVAPAAGAEGCAPGGEPAAPADQGDDLDRWAAFHQAVENLPGEEREVVMLVFYHGWKRAEVAELLQTSVKTVNRRWRTAMDKLHRLLGEAE
jgi:RNA polymerase sigma-70 factor (ECF subfamily)